MFQKVLVANRGEIACRILRTLRQMQIRSVAVYSEVDAHARHVLEADEAYLLGPAPAAQSYLDGTKILQIAQACGAEAIHPGYGFLSENAEFCRNCQEEGIVFIGPRREHLIDFGLKHRARELAQSFAVPLLPGSSLLHSPEDALQQAQVIGYPVMLKSSAGGGGIGMALCDSDEALLEAFTQIQRLSSNNFSDPSLYLEKYIRQARHLEVQVFGDGKGGAMVLGDRDCSVQRRNQKVVEETPAPGLSGTLRNQLHATAQRLAEGIAYQSAGTVEFVFDVESQQFYFLEVNTRLQVEHCVTEEVFGVDLVRWMIELAAGHWSLCSTMVPKPQGAAIEVRLYAEDPGQNFQPSAGVLTEVLFPEDIRVESWVVRGTEVSAYYDPLLAKLIVRGKDRQAAVAGLQHALAQSCLAGLETNLLLLRQIAACPAFSVGIYTTGLLAELPYTAPTISVLTAGMQSTIQDYPGRIGYWSVGVPPSGPMDMLNHRLANRIVGNAQEAATLEMTVQGATLQFHTSTIITLTGAEMEATLDGQSIDRYTPLCVQAGSVLKTGLATSGQRAYLAVRGGFDVPAYMGSCSTFTLGQFGGHAGRSLRPGDVLHIGSLMAEEPCALAGEYQPLLTKRWEIGVLYGPHGAPDFFTDEDLALFFATDWEVHYNSSRTGVRLIGPSPQWARADGGEAGLHPSNIHDNAYAVGAVDFTGDMPVMLGPDGPSLGGFVCPVTVVQAELWKMGQLRAGDRVRFIRLSQEEAERLEERQEHFIQELQVPAPMTSHNPCQDRGKDAAIIATAWHHGDLVVYRRAGDKYLLIEYGEPVLELSLRLHAHALMLAVERQQIEGILDLTPGIRSLQIHYDNRIVPLSRLLSLLEQAEQEIAGFKEQDIPSRVVYLPLSWDDPATHTAIEKYMQSVRADAPWCPSNIEFIRRINGLDRVEDVYKILFDASYLVMGLGDVYLGAPVATPLDPRHRLVTTKYNPARTWTPENAVGIGGAYLCVYGMEGPGGYQFVGRTVQMWNRYNTTPEFSKPWLLRFFDQIRFYPVSHGELLEMRRKFPHGLAGLRVEPGSFNLHRYEQFLAEQQHSIQAFKRRQQQAFELERQAWIANGQLQYHSEEPVAEEPETEIPLEQGCDPVVSPVAGSLWKLHVAADSRVRAGDTIAVVECMKMEISLKAPCNGVVKQVLCLEGDRVSSGQYLASVLPVEVGACS